MLDMIGVELDGVEPKGFELCSLERTMAQTLKRQI
jgi:hypothetical protein